MRTLLRPRSSLGASALRPTSSLRAGWSHHFFGLALLAALMLAPGCMVDVDDDYPVVEDEAGEVEVELIDGLAQSVAADDGSDPRPDVPEASGNPLEIGFEMEPVPEPWQGKGSEK
jgi:hypothetical protein